MTMAVALSNPTDLLRARSGRIEIVNVAQQLIVAVDGVGLPPNEDFSTAIGALYSVAYAAKFDAKARGLDAPKIQPLECVWDMGPANDAWHWRLFIGQLAPLDMRSLKRAIGLAGTKKPNAMLARLDVTRWKEGLCAQTLYIGPYDAMGEAHRALQDGVHSLGYRPSGMPHEIYISDPSRTAPDKLKTIVRIPITQLT